MISEFTNLPGQYVFKEDNNLQVIEAIPGEVTLVIGTSPAGPKGLFRITDTSAAERIYDPSATKEGTLLTGIYEALESGANYVAAYRIGSSPFALDFLNGHTVVIDDGSEDTAADYKIYYTNDYNNEGLELLRLYDSTTGEIVFDSMVGTTNPNILVYGSQVFSANDFSMTIGYDYSDAEGDPTWQNSPTLSALKDFSAYKVSDAFTNQSLNDSTKIATVDVEYFKAGQVVNITSANASDNDGTYVVEYVIDNGDSTYDVAFSKKISYANGVISEEDWTGFTAASDASIDLSVKAISQANGLNLSYNKLYEELDRAYTALEAAKVDMVIPTGVYLDAPNVVDNENRYSTEEAGYIAPSESDFLGKAFRFEHNGFNYYVWKNSFATKDELPADELPTPYELGIDGYAAKSWLEGTHEFDTSSVLTSQADVDAAADDIDWHEVNFAHQLASYLDALSTNDNEASGVIGTRSPANYSPAAISRWLGKSPVWSNNQIIRSGSGLLGNKLMAGSQKNAAGFFRTSNGFVDGSPVMFRNQKIDIGRYIDIVATDLIIRTGYEGSASGYQSPAAPIYGGTIMRLEPNSSPMNKRIAADVALPFTLSKKKLDALTGARYVTFTTGVTGVKVVDAPTAALSTSDYDRRTVNRIASTVVERVRRIADPYIGEVTSPEILQALEDELNNELLSLQDPNNTYLLAGRALVLQTTDQRIKGEAVLQLNLRTATELRRLAIYLKLAR